jgi:hypothetical protein
VRVSGSTLQGEVTSAAHKMTSSFDPSLRCCWTIVAIGGWRGGPGHKKAIVMAELKPDEEFMVVEALYPLCGAGTPRCPARVRKFSRHTIRQMENIAKRIESRSGDPNMCVISTQGERVLTTTSPSKA